MSGQRWKRCTPKSEMSQYCSSDTDFQSPAFLSTKKPAEKKSTILTKGRDDATLFGVTAAKHTRELPENETAPEGNPQSSSACTPAQADFQFWKQNVTDPAKGITTDQKLNSQNCIDADRGVCKSTLMKRSCHLGAACKFKHPARAHEQKTGLDVCLGFIKLTSGRHNLDVGDCLVIRIQEAISLTRFSVWILNHLPTGSNPAEQALQFPHQVFPLGLDTLISNMTAFYQNGGPKYLMFPDMADVVDAFIAVRHNFRGKYSWFRGVPISLDTAVGEQLVLQVRLVDLGKEVSILNVQFVRRLHQKFLEEPYYSTVVGLGGVSILPENASCTNSLKWFRHQMLDKTAFIRVIDVSEVPLVEMHADTKSGLQSIGTLLVDERMAVQHSACDSLGSWTDQDLDERDDLDLQPG